MTQSIERDLAPAVDVHPSASSFPFLSSPSFKGWLLVGAAAVALGAPRDAAAQPVPPDKWDAYIDLTGRFGSHTTGEIGLFVPLWQSPDSVLFADLRGKMSSRETQEGNFGLGYRTQINKDWILGANAFFDIHNSEADNLFIQGGVGVEALSEDWDFRLNGYFPESESKPAAGAGTLQITGNTIQLLGGMEKALWGFDGEVGYRLPFFDPDGDTEIRVFAGGFYFDADGVEPIMGPRLRVEARIYDLDFIGNGSRLTIGGEVTHDDVRDVEGYGSVTLRIPLQAITGGNAPKLKGLDRRMVDRVQRDFDIVTNVGYGAPEDVFVGYMDAPIDTIFFTENGGTGDGTYEGAPDSVSDGLANAGGTPAIIVVEGGGGTYTTAGLDLADGQALVGGGHTVKLTGVNSGTMVNFTAPGTRPTISGTNGGSDALIDIGDNGFVGGFDLTGDMYEGIRALDVNNFQIENNSIGGANSDGIYVTVSNPGSIGIVRDNTVTDAYYDGIDVEIDANDGLAHHFTLKIDGNTVTGSGNNGIEVDVDVNNGSDLDFDFELDGNYAAGNGFVFYGDGVQVEMDADGPGSLLTADVKVTDNTFNENEDDGLDIDMEAYGGATIDVGDTITITGNTAKRNLDDGIDVSGYAWDGSTLDVRLLIDDNFAYVNGSIGQYYQYAIGDGIDVFFEAYNDSVTRVDATITNNTVEGNYDDGIDFAVDADDYSDLYLDLVVSGNAATENGRSLNSAYSPGDGIQIDLFAYNESAIHAENTITVDDNYIEGNYGHGIDVNITALYGSDIDATLGFSGNTIVNNSDFEGYTGGYGFTLLSNELAGIEIEAIARYFGSIELTSTFTDNSIAQNDDDGVRITHYLADYSLIDHDITMTGNSIVFNQDDGVHIESVMGAPVYVNYSYRIGPSNSDLLLDVTLEDNYITRNEGGYGLYIEARAGGYSYHRLDVTLLDNVFSSNERMGVHVDNIIFDNSTHRFSLYAVGNEFNGSHEDGGIEVELDLRDRVDDATYGALYVDIDFHDNTMSNNEEEGAYFDLGVQNGRLIADLDITGNTGTNNQEENIGVEIDVNGKASNPGYISYVIGQAFADIDIDIRDNHVPFADETNIDVEVDLRYLYSTYGTPSTLDLWIVGNDASRSVDREGIYVDIDATHGAIVDATVGITDNMADNNADENIEFELSSRYFSDVMLDLTIADNQASGSREGEGIYVRLDAEIESTLDATVDILDNIANNNEEEGLAFRIFSGDNYQDPGAYVYVDLLIDGNSFSGNEGDGVELFAQATNESFLDLYVALTNNEIQFNDDDILDAYLQVQRYSTGEFEFRITDNEMSYNNDFGSAVDLKLYVATDGASSADNSDANLYVEIARNTFYFNNAGGGAIDLNFHVDGEGDLEADGVIADNVIFGTVDAGGIEMYGNASEEGYLSVEFDILRNRIERTDSEGINLRFGSYGDSEVRLNFDIEDNTLALNGSDGIGVNLDSDVYGTIYVDLGIVNNTIGFNDGAGIDIYVNSRDDSSIDLDATIENNSIYRNDREGIRVYIEGYGASSASVDLDLIDNTITNNDEDGVLISSYSHTSAELDVYALFDGNTIVENGSTADHDGIDLDNREDGGTSVQYATFRDNYIVDNRGAGVMLQNLYGDQFGYFTDGYNTIVDNGLLQRPDVYIFNDAGNQTVDLDQADNNIGDYGSDNINAGTQTILP